MCVCGRIFQAKEITFDAQIKFKGLFQHFSYFLTGFQNILVLYLEMEMARRVAPN